MINSTLSIRVEISHDRNDFLRGNVPVIVAKSMAGSSTWVFPSVLHARRRHGNGVFRFFFFLFLPKWHF